MQCYGVGTAELFGAEELDALLTMLRAALAAACV